MFELLFGIAFVGLLIFIIYIANKSGVEINKARKLAELTRLLENTPRYILNKNKSEHDVLINSFEDKVKTFSDNFVFTNEYLLSLKYKMIWNKFDSDAICNVINENNFAKLCYHEYDFFVNHNDGRFRVCRFFHGDLITCEGSFYVSGEWDNDMKTIFVELYKKCLQKEIKRKLEYIASLDVDAANEFYKNN